MEGIGQQQSDGGHWTKPVDGGGHWTKTNELRSVGNILPSGKVGFLSLFFYRLILLKKLNAIGETLLCRRLGYLDYQYNNP